MPAVKPRRQELETPKEVLAEVFGARPSDVEEMIRLSRGTLAFLSVALLTIHHFTTMNRPQQSSREYGPVDKCNARDY
jgi:hypothetical protein